ncbi:uncharacterized protein LOC120079806 [Benincasa hispida]|uniref:uncharacterized protein LOC120079806 n=1 Tax=Benincasa hispida TaxID=102211 RepID=UPI0018FFB5D4|nr:uncharacterized protein LOC120079806 [Benincasa hispida]
MLEEYLHHFIDARQKNWVQLLDVAQFSFNGQQSSATGKTAFEVVCGRQPLMPHLVDHPYVGKSPQAHNSSMEWSQSSEIAHVCLEKASMRMKKWADKKRRPLEFQAGDKRDQRLVRKYEGPVEVIEKVGKTSYRVQLPSWMKIHPVIHVSILKPYHPDRNDEQRNMLMCPLITMKNSTEKKVPQILDRRTHRITRPRREQSSWEKLKNEGKKEGKTLSVELKPSSRLVNLAESAFGIQCVNRQLSSSPRERELDKNYGNLANFCAESRFEEEAC